MLIVLEGPDGAGKSTLAAAITSFIATKYPRDTVALLHRGPPTRHPLEEYVTPLLDYRPNTGQHIICDRWHWGEVVYPRVLRRATKMDHAVFTYVELFLQSRGGITFLIDSPLDDLRTRVIQRGDDLVRVHQLEEIKQRFTEVIQTSLTGLRLEDPTAEMLVALTRRTEWHAGLLNDFVTPVGSPSPRVLVLGDVRACGGLGCNHKIVHEENGPAFMPYRGTSGHYLLGVDRVCTHNRIAFANACDVDDVARLYRAMNRPSVVALGVNAHERLEKLKIKHAIVPHPQYVRRFHHAAASQYVALINELIGTERNELKWRPSLPQPPGSKYTLTSSRTS